MRLSKWLLTLAAFAGTYSSVAAQDFELSSIIKEVRGGATLSAIELYPNSGVVPVPGTFDIGNLDSLQFDLMFNVPDLPISWLGTLRPAIGGVVNLRGRESVLHGGLNWHIPLGETPFYAEAELGLAIHNGALTGATPPLRNLGCPVLFHWSYGVGANISENMTITANLQHVSNVIYGCHPNQGLNHFGVSLGYKF